MGRGGVISKKGADESLAFIHAMFLGKMAGFVYNYTACFNYFSGFTCI